MQAHAQYRRKIVLLYVESGLFDFEQIVMHTVTSDYLSYIIASDKF